MISFNLWSNARKFCYQLTKYCGSNRKLLSNILHLEGQKLYYHTLETSRNNEETKKFEAKNKDKAKPLKKIHNSSLVPIKLTSRNLVRRKYYNVIDKFVNLARFVFTSKIPNLNLGINQFLSRISKNLLKEDTNNSQYSNSLYILKNCKWLIHSDGKIYGYGSNQVDSTNNAAHSVRFSTECKEPLKSKESSNHGRHNYHQDVECAVNQQILAELNASYAYLSMACYFGRTDVALPGCQGFFLKMHEEEHQHALKLIKYQNMRGGTVKLCPISASEVQDWGCILNALEVSLELEKLIKEVSFILTK